MSTQTHAALVPTTNVKRGFGDLPCPRCMNVGSTVSIDLTDFSHNEAISCAECDEAFGINDIRELVEAWQPVLAWLQTAPELK